MALSVALVLALLAYLVHHGVQAPSGGEPRAEVVATSLTEGGDLRVEVAVTNHAQEGLRAIVVQVPCDEPPPQLTLENVPAQGERRGIILCPEGSANFTAEVSSYVWT